MQKTERELGGVYEPRARLIGNKKPFATVMDVCFIVVQMQDDNKNCCGWRMERWKMENVKQVTDISIVFGETIMSTDDRS